MRKRERDQIKEIISHDYENVSSKFAVWVRQGGDSGEKLQFESRKPTNDSLNSLLLSNFESFIPGVPKTLMIGISEVALNLVEEQIIDLEKEN